MWISQRFQSEASNFKCSAIMLRACVTPSTMMSIINKYWFVADFFQADDDVFSCNPLVLVKENDNKPQEKGDVAEG